MNATTTRTRSALLATVLLACGGMALRPDSAPAAETNAIPSAVLAALAQPPRHLLFREVIHTTTGHRILPLDTNNSTHADLREQILRAAAEAGRQIRKQGLSAARVNEAGNRIEPFVREALNRVGVASRVPVTSDGRGQAAGYPDIEITAPIPCYLELKAYSAATMNTTQRSFYYSPSASPKITRDALHLLLAYELEASHRDGQTAFVPRHWKLISLHDLEVDLKFEFNQSNRGLYGQPQSVLGESALPPE